MGQNRGQTFCRAVIIQTRKTQEVSHQREEPRKPFPSISLSFAHCRQGSSSHCDPPPESIRDFYKQRTDSLELGVDILQIPLERFTVQFASQLHSVCNTGNTGSLLRIRQWTGGRGTMKIGQEIWGQLCDFLPLLILSRNCCWFRALAGTWGEEERGKWQEIEMEDKHLQRAVPELPLTQSDGRAQVLPC